jgi:hypothetical protein
MPAWDTVLLTAVFAEIETPNLGDPCPARPSIAGHIKPSRSLDRLIGRIVSSRRSPAGGNVGEAE